MKPTARWGWITWNRYWSGSGLILPVSPWRCRRWTADYERLIRRGLNSVLIYQETYNSHTYNSYHPKGKKSNMAYRLETPDRLGTRGDPPDRHRRAARAGGLAVDSAFVALHPAYLERCYWRTRYPSRCPGCVLRLAASRRMWW